MISHMATLGGPKYILHTLPETNMETQKGPTIKTTVLLKRDYMGFHVSLGECTFRNTMIYQETWLSLA